jgi:hypothetical protein
MFEWDSNKYEETVEKSKVEQRKEICGSCEQLNKFKVCKQCGCFMPVKIRLGDFVGCPLKKW